MERGQKTVVPLQGHAGKASNSPVNIGEPLHIARTRVCAMTTDGFVLGGLSGIRCSSQARRYQRRVGAL